MTERAKAQQELQCKCGSATVVVYELEVPLVHDPRMRELQLGYVCRKCRRTAVHVSRRGLKAEVRWGTEDGEEKPKCHPQMQRMLTKAVKGMKIAAEE